MPLRRLTEYLDENAIKYTTIRHTPAYTAQGIAASAHIPGRELAKSVVVRVDGKLALVVLPASQRVDLLRLKEAIGAQKVELADEQTFGDSFPGCEVGAMPPFGNLYGMNVYVARSLAYDDQIAFNAGTHTELIQLAYEDFEDLVHPAVGDFAEVTH